MSEAWYLYVLECRHGRLYTGITPDLQARFNKHCAGKRAMFTRLNPPQRMLAAKRYGNRSQASAAERRMKGLSKTQKRRVTAIWPHISDLPSRDSG